MGGRGNSFDSQLGQDRLWTAVRSQYEEWLLTAGGDSPRLEIDGS